MQVAHLNKCTLNARDNGKEQVNYTHEVLLALDTCSTLVHQRADVTFKHLNLTV